MSTSSNQTFLPLFTSRNIPLETLLLPGVVVRIEIPRKSKPGVKQVLAMTTGGAAFDGSSEYRKISKALQKAVRTGKPLKEKYMSWVDDIPLVVQLLPVEPALDAAISKHRGKPLNKKAAGELRVTLLARAPLVSVVTSQVNHVVHDNVTHVVTELYNKFVTEEAKTQDEECRTGDNQPA